MSAFRDIMSIVDPAAAKTTTAPRQASSAALPKPTPRPAGGANGLTSAPQLKRKASGSADGSQVKIQKKDGSSQLGQTNGSARSTAAPAAARQAPSISTSSIPYRGTAAPTSSKVASPLVKRPTIAPRTSSAPPKAAAPAPVSAPKPAPAVTTLTTASAGAPKKGYLALLAKAKEKETTKPAAPAVKVEPTKILTKKERLALKTETNASAKGKKLSPGAPLKPTDVKGDASKAQRKPAGSGYQGTARPTKKPESAGYRGTARPASVPAPSSRNGAPAAKAKPKAAKGRYDGYVEWSDLDDDGLEDEEDDYASDASSDMEGGIWDVEQEEQLALKVAKKEDAQALAEEMEAKRQKEERKKKLMQMSKERATKRKY